MLNRSWIAVCISSAAIFFSAKPKADELRPSSRQALVYSPFHHQEQFVFSLRRLRLPQRIADVLQGRGLSVTAISDRQAGLEEIRNLARYGAIFINSHGGVGETKLNNDPNKKVPQYVFLTGQPYGDVERRLADSYPEWYIGTGCDACNSEYLGVTEHYIRDRAGRLPRSTIYLNTCHGFDRPSMVESLVGQGALAIIGWQGTVPAPDVVDTAWRFISRIDEGKTVEDAWSLAGGSNRYRERLGYSAERSDLRLLCANTEMCDTIDNDCDGHSDEDLQNCLLCGEPGSQEVDESCGGPCQSRSRTCREDRHWTNWTDCLGSNDCLPGEALEHECGVDVGACQRGTQQQFCTNECQWGALGPCQGGINPAPETCNDTDDDCDGRTDEGSLCGDGRTCQNGLCLEQCIPEPELCDGMDNDCNNDIDDVPPEIGEDVPISLPGSIAYTSSSALVWTGQEYGITWIDSGPPGDVFPNGGQIFFRRISADGHLVGNQFPITERLGHAYHPSLIWNGAGYALTWSERRDGINPQVYFALLTADGAVFDETRVTDSPFGSSSPHLTWTGSEYGLLWEDNRDGDRSELYFIRLSPQGELVGGEIRITNAPGWSSPGSFIWNGNEFVVLWTDERDHGDNRAEVYFARLSGRGEKIGDDVRISHSRAPSEFPDLVWTGDGYGAVWSDSVNENGGDSRVFFTRLSLEGELIGDIIELGAAAIASCGPHIIRDGRSFAVVWSDQRWNGDCPGGAYDAYFARVSQAGEVLENDFRLTEDCWSNTMDFLWNGEEHALVTLEPSADGWAQQLMFIRGLFACP